MHSAHSGFRIHNVPDSRHIWDFPFVINTPEAGFCDHAATPGERLWWPENLLFHIQLGVSNCSLPLFHSLPVQWCWLNSEWWVEVTLCFEKELPWIWRNKPRVKIWSHALMSPPLESNYISSVNLFPRHDRLDTDATPKHGFVSDEFQQ